MKRRDKVLKRIGMAFLTVLMFFAFFVYPSCFQQKCFGQHLLLLEERYDNLLLSEEDLKSSKIFPKEKPKLSEVP